MKKTWFLGFAMNRKKTQFSAAALPLCPLGLGREGGWPPPLLWELLRPGHCSTTHSWSPPARRPSASASTAGPSSSSTQLRARSTPLASLLSRSLIAWSPVSRDSNSLCTLAVASAHAASVGPQWDADRPATAHLTSSPGGSFECDVLLWTRSPVRANVGTNS